VEDEDDDQQRPSSSSKRSKPYQMMDINELDEHHMATITRKSAHGLNLNSEEDGGPNVAGLFE
jgi:hypothetical protein